MFISWEAVTGDCWQWGNPHPQSQSRAVPGKEAATVKHTGFPGVEKTLDRFKVYRRVIGKAEIHDSQGHMPVWGSLSIPALRFFLRVSFIPGHVTEELSLGITFIPSKIPWVYKLPCWNLSYILGVHTIYNQQKNWNTNKKVLLGRFFRAPPRKYN